MLTTWRQLLNETMKENVDSLDGAVCTLSEEELDVKFDAGYGGVEGKPFTVWTERFVYFPLCYDGAEGVACVSRNPNGQPTQHVGGG